jgi:hypothetical protein
MRRKRLIPFGLLPGSWGLAGSTRAIAEAEYYLQGEECERAIADIRYKGESRTELRDWAHLEISKKYGKIGEEEYERKKADLTIQDKKALALKQLEIDKRYAKLTAVEYEHKVLDLTESDEKTRQLKHLAIDLSWGSISLAEHDHKAADIKGEPWCIVLSSKFDPEKETGFELELDYNEYFVKFLTEKGYKGLSDDQIVEEWFNDLCKSIAFEEEFLGSEALTPTVQNSLQTPPTVIRKDPLGDGGAAYS